MHLHFAPETFVLCDQPGNFLRGRTLYETKVLPDTRQLFPFLFDYIQSLLANHCLQTPYPCCNRSLRQQAKNTQFAGGADMRAAAQFNRPGRIERNDAYAIFVFFPKKRYGAPVLRLRDRHIEFDKCLYIALDYLVDSRLHGLQHFRRHTLVVAKVETQPVGSHKRPPLLYMLPQRLAQRRMEQMCRSVVFFDAASTIRIHHSMHQCIGIVRQSVDAVHNAVLFFLRVQHPDMLPPHIQYAGIPYLSAAFSIKRRAVEYDFVLCTGCLIPSFFFILTVHLR